MNQDPMIEWNDMVTDWLSMIDKQLCAHAVSSAQGERGVLLLTITKKQMAAMLATKKLPPGTKTQFAMNPSTWVPFESFLDGIRDTHVDPTAAERYRPALEVMDPTRDVALFLSSAEDGSDGGTYTRFLVLPDPHAPRH